MYDDDYARVTRRRWRSESGQTIVLFALLLPVFLGLGAIAVDVGTWYVTGKQAQNAADAGALAAAREIPNGGSVEARGHEYVGRNMPHATSEVEYPYVPDWGPNAGTPDPAKVEVTVTHSAGAFFGRVLGFFNVDVTRRAVAEKWEVPGTMAIFSHNDECGSGDGLEFNGSNISVNGYIHSNGQYDVNSGNPPDDDFWAADGTISKNNCVANLDPRPQGATYGEGPDFLPRDIFETLNWPVWFTPAQFGWLTGCTYWGQKIEVKSNQVIISSPNQTINFSGGVIPTGTYCATESFVINADNLTGTITALAPEVKVDGNNITLMPHQLGVLLFTVPNNDLNASNDGSLEAGGNPVCNPSPSKEMQLNGNSHTWAGYIINNCGRVLVNVGGSSIGSPALVGTIIGEQVKINGPDFFMIGKDDFSGTIQLGLYE